MKPIKLCGIFKEMKNISIKFKWSEYRVNTNFGGFGVDLTSLIFQIVDHRLRHQRNNILNHVGH